MLEPYFCSYTIAPVFCKIAWNGLMITGGLTIILYLLLPKNKKR